MTSASPKPLANLRVLELARVLAGPWAGQLLADLGANVIKVEETRQRRRYARVGAAIRRGSRRRAVGRLLSCGNRGKTSIALDLESRRTQAGTRARAASRRDDRELQGRRLGKIRPRLRFPQHANPRLIYCSITGFGQTGPMLRVPATTTSSRAWAASWTSPASPTASRRKSASPSPISSPVSMRPPAFWLR